MLARPSRKRMRHSAISVCLVVSAGLTVCGSAAAGWYICPKCGKPHYKASESRQRTSKYPSYRYPAVAGGSTRQNRQKIVIPPRPRPKNYFDPNVDFSGQRYQIIDEYNGTVWKSNPYDTNGNLLYGYPNDTYRYDIDGNIIYAPPRPKNAPPNRRKY